MAKLVRFGVSIDERLLDQFDRQITKHQYRNRSEAIRDLIRESLVLEEWNEEKILAGGIALVYDHHHAQLVNQLIEIQHDYHDLVISSQHIHVDHDNCLEIIIVKGKSQDIRTLYDRLRSTRGIKHINILKSTTGQDLP
jgi:CopG family nickel-responsive transcriptional regulator